MCEWTKTEGARFTFIVKSEALAKFNMVQEPGTHKKRRWCPRGHEHEVTVNGGDRDDCLGDRRHNPPSFRVDRQVCIVLVPVPWSR